MQLSLYISNLLFDHDCVTVPGFGSFLGNYKSAEYDLKEQKFSNEKGINRSVYQRWESGEDLNLTSFLKLCDMHHISASALFIKWEQANRLMPKDQPNN